MKERQEERLSPLPARALLACYRRDARMLARGLGSGLKSSWLRGLGDRQNGVSPTGVLQSLRLCESEHTSSRVDGGGLICPPLKPRCDNPPIDNLPKRREMSSTTILVIQIIRMLPDIKGQ